MKILFFNRNPKLWIGGDAIQVEKTAESLRKLGYEVNIVFEPYLLDENYDIYHIFHLNFNWSKAALEWVLKNKKPYVVSAVFFPKVYASTFNEMRDYVNQSLFTIALSEKEKEEMVYFLKCNPEKIIIIPNGVDKSIFYPDKNIKKEDFVISIGRLQEAKGIEFLIEACNKLNLPLRYISSECKGDWAYKIKAKIQDYYQNISPKEVANLLRRSKVYVCPSLTERHSLGVLEAVSCGLPVVDSIFHRGANHQPSSLIVDPRDTNQLAEAIKKQWGKENHDKVLSWDEVAKIIFENYVFYLNAYQKLKKFYKISLDN